MKKRPDNFFTYKLISSKNTILFFVLLYISGCFRNISIDDLISSILAKTKENITIYYEDMTDDIPGTSRTLISKRDGKNLYRKDYFDKSGKECVSFLSTPQNFYIKSILANGTVRDVSRRSGKKAYVINEYSCNPISEIIFYNKEGFNIIIMADEIINNRIAYALEISSPPEKYKSTWKNTKKKIYKIDKETGIPISIERIDNLGKKTLEVNIKKIYVNIPINDEVFDEQFFLKDAQITDN